MRRDGLVVFEVGVGHPALAVRALQRDQRQVGFVADTGIVDQVGVDEDAGAGDGVGEGVLGWSVRQPPRQARPTLTDLGIDGLLDMSRAAHAAPRGRCEPGTQARMGGPRGCAASNAAAGGAVAGGGRPGRWNAASCGGGGVAPAPGRTMAGVASDCTERTELAVRRDDGAARGLPGRPGGGGAWQIDAGMLQHQRNVRPWHDSAERKLRDQGEQGQEQPNAGMRRIRKPLARRGRGQDASAGQSANPSSWSLPCAPQFGGLFHTLPSDVKARMILAGLLLTVSAF